MVNLFQCVQSCSICSKLKGLVDAAAGLSPLDQVFRCLDLGLYSTWVDAPGCLLLLLRRRRGGRRRGGRRHEEDDDEEDDDEEDDDEEDEDEDEEDEDEDEDEAI